MKQIIVIITLIATSLSTACGQTITKSNGQYFVNGHVLHDQGLHSLLENHRVAHYPYSMYKEKKKRAIFYGIGSASLTLFGLDLMTPSLHEGILGIFTGIFEAGIGVVITGLGVLGGIITLTEISSCNNSFKRAIGVYNEDATTFINGHRSEDECQIALGTTGNGIGLLVSF